MYTPVNHSKMPARIAGLSLTFASIFSIAYLAIYWSSLETMAAIWFRSETYAHGMLVPVISSWLIYRKLDQLRQVHASPFWLALPLTVGSTFVWLLARAADILVIEHLATVSTLLCFILFIQGWSRVRQILFPLGYLFFAVPFGEELTPWLQQVTADITVAALQISGIPVYVNGLFLEVPTGRFEVAEACSGIRYLIASLAVGTLFGYLTYTSLKKRLIFTCVAIVVPIIANGIRAYLIVLIAYLSDMKYATGVDHLIYGWLFFGIIIMLLFWLGSYWRDDDQEPTNRALGPTNATTSVPQQISAALATIVILALTAQINSGLSASASSPAGISFDSAQLEIRGAEPMLDAESWSPQFVNPDRQLSAAYRDLNNQRIDLYLADYAFETQGKELINALNRPFPEPWVRARKSSIVFTLEQQAISFNLIELRHPDERKRLLLYAYQVNERLMANELEVKLTQALFRLSGEAPYSRAIILSTMLEDFEAAAIRLEQFLQQNWGEITELPSIKALQN